PQKQFWLLDQAEPNSSHYNVRAAIKIAGPLEAAKLQVAFGAVLARHEILRTTFVLNEGSPVQSIAPSLPFALDVSDLSKLEATHRENEVQRVLGAEAEEHFDLARGPLFRVRLLKLGRDEHLLLITLHHIICDGWSIDVLLRELMTRYQSDASAPQLLLQYADFALWQRERFQSEALTSQMDYWKQKLANAPAALELPTDYRRPQTRTFNGAQESL